MKGFLLDLFFFSSSFSFLFLCWHLNIDLPSKHTPPSLTHQYHRTHSRDSLPLARQLDIVFFTSSHLAIQIPPIHIPRYAEKPILSPSSRNPRRKRRGEMISYLPSSPSPFLRRRQLFESFLRYNDGAIFCFILCNQKRKGKVCMHASKRTTRGSLYLFFVFSDARVILIILRRACYRM